MTNGAGAANLSGESGDTPYDAALGAFDAHSLAARQNAAAIEQVEATLTAHEFNRDPDVMAKVARMHELQAQADQAAADARAHMVSNHAQGKEYHGTGTDAAATAFRP